MVKERPILFSGPMVRAILEGRKSQTRRAVKPVGKDDGFVLLDHGKGWWPYRSDDGESSMHTVRRRGALYLDETPMDCPYGQPGDRLWVKETWQAFFADEVPADRPRGPRHTMGVPAQPERESFVFYRADGELEHSKMGGARWNPSIHLPRRYSRLTLEVTGVRVERLQAISHQDAIAEGVACIEGAPLRDERLTVPQHIYAHLWESINGAGSWAANPWVWVIEFKRTTEVPNERR